MSNIKTVADKQKKCPGCLKIKPASKFYIARFNRLGVAILSSKCIKCTKKVGSAVRQNSMKLNKLIGMPRHQFMAFTGASLTRLFRGATLRLRGENLSVKMESWNKGNFTLEFTRSNDDPDDKVGQFKQSEALVQITMIRSELDLPEEIDEWTNEQWTAFRDVSLRYWKEKYQDVD